MNNGKIILDSNEREITRLITSTCERFKKGVFPDGSRRPTLIIGVGGTGQAFVARLKRRIIHLFGEDQKFFQFLVLDTTAKNSLSELSDSEFCYLGGFQPDLYIAACQRQVDAPALDWWPHGFKIHKSVTDGSGQVRVVGRLALFFKINLVMNAVNDMINAAIAATQHRNPAAAAKAKVYIACSLAGGTGSGMFMDLAYLVRHAFGERQIHPYITGIFLMDDAFEVALRPYRSQVRRTRANTYAALRELLHFTENPEAFECRYASDLEVRADRAPFDIAYLLSTVNANMASVGDGTQIVEIAAQGAFLEICSPLGQEFSNAFDNVFELGERHLDRKTCFSSFSVAALTNPVRAMLDYATRDFTADLLEHTLLAAPADPSAPGARAEDFIDSLQIREDQNQHQLVDALRMERDESGQPHGRVGVDVPADWASSIPAVELPSEAGEVQKGVLRSLDECAHAITRHADTIHRRLRPAIEESTGAIVNQPGLGLVSARAFLRTLIERLDHFGRKLWREAEQHHRNREAHEQGAESALARMREALAEARFWKAKACRPYVTAFQDHLEAFAREALEAGLRNSARTLLAELQREAEDVLQQVSKLAGDFSQIARALKADAWPALTRAHAGHKAEFVLCEYARTPAQIVEEYEKKKGAIHAADVLAQFVEAQKKSIWQMRSESRAEIGTGLSWFIGDFWRRESMHDEDVLAVLKRHGATPAEVIASVRRVVELAAPAWNYVREETMLDGSPLIVAQSVAGVASANGTASSDYAQLAGAMPGFSFVSTQDPTAIVVMKIEHGLALHNLARMPLLRSEYLAVQKDNAAAKPEEARPLHLNPAWAEVMEDPIPDELLSGAATRIAEMAV